MAGASAGLMRPAGIPEAREAEAMKERARKEKARKEKTGPLAPVSGSAARIQPR
jgi:hypothetical protein